MVVKYEMMVIQMDQQVVWMTDQEMQVDIYVQAVTTLLHQHVLKYAAMEYSQFQKVVMTAIPMTQTAAAQHAQLRLATVALTL